jgi:hypothetical protein
VQHSNNRNLKKKKITNFLELGRRNKKKWTHNSFDSLHRQLQMCCRHGVTKFRQPNGRRNSVVAALEVKKGWEREEKWDPIRLFYFNHGHWFSIKRNRGMRLNIISSSFLSTGENPLSWTDTSFLYIITWQNNITVIL